MLFNESCRPHTINLRRTIGLGRLGGREKLSLPPGSTSQNHSHGCRRHSKSRYFTETSDFPSDSSTMERAISCLSFNRTRERRSPARPYSQNNPTQNYIYYRSYPSHDAGERYSLEYAKHGERTRTERSHHPPDMATTQLKAASDSNIQAQPGQTICRETARYSWTLSQSSGQSPGVICRREKSNSSSRPYPAHVSVTSGNPRASNIRLHASWDNNFVCRIKYDRRQSHRRLYASSQASGIYTIPADYHCQNSAGFGSTSHRGQLWSS